MKNMLKKYTNIANKLSNYPAFGSKNTNVVDMLVGLLLAISPLLQHYKGFVVNAGILVLILCLPYVCIKLLLRFKSLPWKNILIVVPLVLFQAFRVLAHGTTFMELAHAAVLCGYFTAIVLGGINLKYVARSAYLVAMAAGVGIILQGICYYFFGFHLQLVATGLLLEESNAWVKLAQTGTIGITGAASAFYRPSAFFLEPSHMFLYFVPNLFLLLLTPEMNWMKRISAVVLSVGLLLSTSGMGIALVVGAWLLQLGFSSGKENRLHIKHFFTKQNFLRCVAFVLIFAVIVVILPFLRYSILRVFLGSQTVNSMILAEKNKDNTKPTVQTQPIVPTGQPQQNGQTGLTEPVIIDPTAYTEVIVPTVVPDDPWFTVTQYVPQATEAPQFTESPQASEVPGATEAPEATRAPDAPWFTETQEAPQDTVPTQKPTNSKNPGSTAISGRTERAISLIRHQMSGSQYLVGVSDNVDNVNFNLPGFFSTMYKYGIIGTVLSYIFYLCCAVFAKGAYRWMAIIILVISFVSAHTHGTFYMLFYVLMLMEGLIRKAALDEERQ